MLGLLKLPKSVQDMVLHNKISMGHARVLSKLEDYSQIEVLANRVVNEELSVRELEKLADSNYKRSIPIKQRKSGLDSEYKYIEDIMKEKLGAKVTISKNKVQISYDSPNDLSRILEILDIKIDE
jgi:ParB family chromosome partitioning protein